MIVTLCGAYRNAGDHLIGERARALLRAFVDPEVINIDRKAIGPEHYDVFNKARAVVLCGGPAYQREMYPKIYPLERQRIAPPIVPLGLGWKSPAAKDPRTFVFQPAAAEFIQGIHSSIPASSARDPLTVEVLAHAGVENAWMTGCPAWYDLSTFEDPYVFREDVRRLILSMPAIMQPGVAELTQWLDRRFPRAERVLSFHHGIVPEKSPKGRERGRAFIRFASEAKRRGWKIVGLAGSLPKLQALYESSDLHIGYRVHAHLFCLSRRISSILINEDSRGVGQCKALGAPNLTIDGDNIEHIIAAVDAHFEQRGEGVEQSVSTMRDTFSTMRRFLEML